ncbi:hypothetical protein QYZ88_010255 [Lachnospiraceae bacterium C1.1]|nr:hypothetical protein [Lachnospiraceae bacterium C1.1]
MEVNLDYSMLKMLGVNRTEVTNMCLTEYNEAETMEMLREEAREEGRSEGIKEGMSQTADAVLRAISGGATVEDIQKMLTKEKSGTAKK